MPKSKQDLFSDQPSLFDLTPAVVVAEPFHVRQEDLVAGPTIETVIAETVIEETAPAAVIADADVSRSEPSRITDESLVDPSQTGLFGDGEWWEGEWKGMPEFVQNDLEPFKTLYVHFESKKDMDAFAKLIGQTMTMNTRSMWYPEAEYVSKLNKRYVQAPVASETVDEPTDNLP